MKGTTLFEILLIVILASIVLFLIIAITLRSKESINHGINVSMNNSGNVIKMAIENISVEDISNPQQNEYLVKMNVSFENYLKSIDAIPILNVGNSYALCNDKKITIPNGRSVRECEFIIDTDEDLIYKCDNSVGNYIDCIKKISKGQTIVIGNYTVKFVGAFFKMLSKDYNAKFYIYDGSLPYRNVEVSNEYVSGSAGTKYYHTELNGGWMNITFWCDGAKKYGPSLIEIRSFGSPKNPYITKNLFGIYLYPAGCNFWNSPMDSSKKIIDTISYCGDAPIGYAKIGYLLKNNVIDTCGELMY